MALHPEAVLADSVHADFDLVDSAGEGFLERIGIDPQAFRSQAIHLSASFAVEMRVRQMVPVGRQPVIKCPAAGAEPIEHPMIDQQIENAVDRHPVDRTAALQSLEDVCSRKRIPVVSHDFQDAEPISGNLQFGGL